MSSSETAADPTPTPVRRLEARFRALLRWIRAEYDLVAVVLGVVLYTIFWSWISILKFMSLHASIYDAGLFIQQWYDGYTVHWTLSSFFWSFTGRGLPFVLGPLAFFQSYPLLLTVQSGVIGVGALPIYGVSRILGSSRLVRSSLAGSYLLFFPLAGANWFDIHDEAFFPTLLMLGFFFLLRKNYAPSMAFFVLASFTRYPLSVLVAAFAFGALVETLLIRDRKGYGWADRKFLLVLLFVSGGLFLVRYAAVLVYLHNPLPGDIHINAPAAPVTPTDALLTVVLLLGPFLFLSLRSLRWALPIVLWFGLAFVTGFWAYNYPDFVTTQYAYDVTPFILLGAAEALAWIRNYHRPSKVPAASPPVPAATPKRGWRRIRREPALAVSILACVVVLALFFQPYGPLNGTLRGTGFNAGPDLAVNATQFTEVQQVMTLVPRSDPYVVVQNDLPEFFPRYFGYTTIGPETAPGWLEVPGINYGGLVYNLTYEAANSSWVPLRIDYIVADLNLADYFQHDPPPYNLTMAQLVQNEYATGRYGILAEVSGILVLEHGYSGPPKMYQPISVNLTANALDSAYHRSGLVSITNLTTGPHQWLFVWKSPSIVASPGTYRINLLIQARVANPAVDSIELIAAITGNTLVYSDYFYINHLDIPGNDSWGWIHFTISIQNFTDGLVFFGQLNPNGGWTGAFSLERISLVQSTVPNG